MKIRILDVVGNKMTIITNVQEVKSCGNFFRVLFTDNSFKDYLFKTFDWFPVS